MMARPAHCGASGAEGLRRIREIERRRLSRALHDQAGPLLCSAGLLAEMLYGAIPSPSPQQEELFSRLRNALESAVESVRLLSQESSPDLAGRRGLEGALATLAQAYGAELHIETLPGPPERLSRSLCELVRDALLVCDAAQGPARIHLTRGGVRVEAGCEADEAITGALEAAALEAGFGFSFRQVPAAVFEFHLEENA